MDDTVLSVNLKLGFDTFQFMFGKLSTYYLVAMDNATWGNNFWFEFFSGLKVTFFRETNTN